MSSPHEPTLLIATRTSGQTTEAEPVLVEHEGDSIVLVLDDGTRLDFDAVELREAA